jgi:hypothetical protein
MRRRTFMLATLGSVAIPSLAAGQQEPVATAAPPSPAPQLIEPQNALEYAFVSALDNENMRPVFRRYLLDTHVALALQGAGANAEPLEVQVREGFRAGAVFTSAARLDAVLGAAAPRAMINGRAAFERLRGKNVVINYRLLPMLTLEASDVARYLEAPGESSAGPTQ